MLYDTHAHLDFDPLKNDIAKIISDAKLSGVGFINTIGVEVKNFQNILEIANKFENIYCSIGQHPCHMEDDLINSKELFDIIIKFCQNEKKIVAIGESGLDYYDKFFSSSEKQKKYFITQIEASIKIRKPLIIHHRNAENDLFDIVKNYNSKISGVLHCYTGTYDLAKKMLDLGFYISFSGIVTFKNADELRNVVKKISLDQILIETDAPFLAPEPIRGNRNNQPKYITETAKFLSNFLQIDYENFCQITTQNAKKLFNIC